MEKAEVSVKVEDKKEGPKRTYSPAQPKKRLYYRKKICRICHNNELGELNYKNVPLLRKFITEKGKIVPRRLTGACAKHQRQLTQAVKQARTIAFIPFTEV